MTAAIADVCSSNERERRVEEAVDWWAELRAELSGKDLELDSAICYHRGQLHARLFSSPPLSGSDRRDGCRHCWSKAVDAWTELPGIAFHYPPTVRASSTRAMQKHNQHMQQAAEHLQSAAPLLSLYSLDEEQMAALQLLSLLYSALLMHAHAAAAILQCGILHLGSGRLRDAHSCLSQAEALRAQHCSASSLAQADQYSLLHARLSLLLHPTSPPLPPPACLSSASLLSSPPPLHAAERIFHAQQLDLLSLLLARGGRGSQGLQIGEAAYLCWSSLMRKLAASADQQDRDSSQPAAAKKGQRVAAARRAAAGDDGELDEEEERRVDRAERDDVHHSHARRIDGLLSSVSTLTSPHRWLILSSFLSSLRHRALQLEQQGDVRQCLDCLTKAAAISSALEATAHGRKAEMLRRRVRLKLGRGDEDSKEADTDRAVTVLTQMRQEWEEERRADAAASSEEEADQQRLLLPQSAYRRRLLHLRHSVELADGCRRLRLQEAALEAYTHALTLIDRLMRSSPLLAASPVEERPAVTRRTRGRKAQTAIAAVSPAGAEVISNSPVLLAYRAQVEAKVASLSLQASCDADTSSAASSAQSLLTASAVLSSHHALVDAAWCCYWRHRAQADCSAAPAAWSSAQLRGAVAVKPVASTALLQSGIAACFGLSPPHLMRLLFLSLSATTGLTSPVDAAFALNCSVGITARHAAIAAVTDRSEPSSQPASEQGTDGLTAQLDRLQLTDSSSDSEARHERDSARVRQLHLFSLDGGLEADRRRFEIEYLQHLPLHWTVVTVALSDDSRHLLLSRIRSAKHEAAPILLLRLPLIRSVAAAAPAQPPEQHVGAAARPTRSASQSRSRSSSARPSPVSSLPHPTPSAASSSSPRHNALDAAIAELAAILRLSGEMNDSVRSSKADDFTAQQREDWWTGRRRLDERMRLMLEQLEDGCFGAWRGALAGLHRGEADRQRQQQATLSVQSALHDALSITAAAAPSSPLYAYVEALLSAPSCITASQLEPGLMYLLGWTDDMNCSTDEAEELRRSQPSSAQQQLARLVRQLQQARQRLLSGSGGGASERQPVILLLSSQLQHLPFESMPVLAPHPVTRMPSFLFLLQHMTGQAGAEPESGSCSAVSLSSHSFILNPSGDLARTEATFSPLLPALGLTRGLTSSAPSPSAFLSALSSEFFLYIGHAAGDQYVSLHAVARRASPSVCVLMGCGSGRWKGSSTEYEGWGMVSALLVAGARAVVGNLWDVTDGEIDRLCVRLLHGITGRQAGPAAQGERQTAQQKGGTRAAARKGEKASESMKSPRTPLLSELVVDSRSACHLRYLMGASPVVFGIPVAFQLETK